jgi:hypothetical protein
VRGVPGDRHPYRDGHGYPHYKVQVPPEGSATVEIIGEVVDVAFPHYEVQDPSKGSAMVEAIREGADMVIYTTVRAAFTQETTDQRGDG